MLMLLICFKIYSGNALPINSTTNNRYLFHLYLKKIIHNITVNMLPLIHFCCQYHGEQQSFCNIFSAANLSYNNVSRLVIFASVKKSTWY